MGLVGNKSGSSFHYSEGRMDPAKSVKNIFGDVPKQFKKKCGECAIGPDIVEVDKNGRKSYVHKYSIYYNQTSLLSTYFTDV